MRTRLIHGTFHRPEDGAVEWTPLDPHQEWQPQESVLWRSQGGLGKTHPDRSLPKRVEVQFNQPVSNANRVHLIGVFALHADELEESVGAEVMVYTEAGVLQFPLLYGRHYDQAECLRPMSNTPGDGTELTTVGRAEIDGIQVRVDRLTLDLPAGSKVERIAMVDLGTPASFGLFEVHVEILLAQVCPFSNRAPGVSLGEVGMAVRVGDRVRLSRAFEQLDTGLRRVGGDLDEARGSALLFLAVISAAKLESGTRRPLHKFQLDAARKLEAASTIDAIIDSTRALGEMLMGEMLEDRNPNDALIDRAIALIDRGYGRPLADTDLAKQLGLSNSHFRFLFKQATGQPFHKYLMAVRLEKARTLIADGDLPIVEIAKQVGFASSAHFTRAFQSRFQLSPSQVRANNR